MMMPSSLKQASVLLFSSIGFTTGLGVHAVEDGNANVGGEKARFIVAPFTPEVTFRQSFCDRYDIVSRVDPASSFSIKNALSGVELRPILQYGDGFPYFHYDPETGIDPEDPGLVANILDYIGAPERANFTWRNSFGVYRAQDKGPNKTWTEMLQWTTNTFDIGVDKWAQSTERLNKGIAFCEPWFDASMILVDAIDNEATSKVNYWNWLKPFDMTVWWVTLATIVFSCFCYQFLEYMAGERGGRSFRKWFMDNLYLSSVNFTQNYIYEPTSLAAKVFGVSFALWTMLIGATYTANLASLLVEQNSGEAKIAGIEDGIQREMAICTFENANSDLFLQRRYPNARRVPVASPELQYDAVNSGTCDLLLGSKQAWLGFSQIEEYNPNCNLEWVGRTVEIVNAAFATKVDPGVKCTSLVNEVFNYWLSEMKDADFLNEEWEKFDSQQATPDFDCNANIQEENDGRRRLAQRDGRRRRRRRLAAQQQLPDTRRRLKGGGSKGGSAGGAAAAESAASSDEEFNEEEDSLTLDQMAGIFFVHAIGCIAAIIVSMLAWYEKKSNVKRHGCKKPPTEEEMDREQARARGSAYSKGAAVNISTSESSDENNPFQAQLDRLQAQNRELSVQMNMMMTLMRRMESRDRIALMNLSPAPGYDEDDDNSFQTAESTKDGSKKAGFLSRFYGGQS